MSKQPNSLGADDQDPEDGEEGSDLQSLEDVLDWVKSLTALGVTPDAAFAGTAQIMISKMGNDAQSDLADKAAANASDANDQSHEHSKETTAIGHSNALDLLAKQPKPTVSK